VRRTKPHSSTNFSEWGANAAEVRRAGTSDTVEGKQLGDLMTFKLSISKWVKSQVTRVMGFLPANFQLATPFHSRLRVRHGIDRQTDDGH